MPNWCEGTFRARGSADNIRRFILKGLGACSGKGEDRFSIEERLLSDGSFEYTIHGQDMAWIKGTRRHFFVFEYRDTICPNEKKNGELCFAAPFRAAWAIDEDQISEIAKEYEIDIRVNGYECGMEFEQTVEVSRSGKIITCSEIVYEDYLWECSMPLLGG